MTRYLQYWPRGVYGLLIALSFTAAADSPKKSTQFGGTRLDFRVDGWNAFVILPERSAGTDTRPWIWYAPTFIGGHPDESHEWLASRLLDRGIALAGIEVGESYGSPTGVDAYNAFYNYVTREYAFDAKAMLLAQSRGGLMLLNWAVENAENVQCIAGIYAVCNLESYPGLERACGAYGMTEDELRANLKSVNPVERLGPLAEAGIPHFFIHGDSDAVVPIEANAELLVNRLRGLGGDARLAVVPGKGHEVCPEFFESEELLGFLVENGKQTSEK